MDSHTSLFPFLGTVPIRTSLCQSGSSSYKWRLRSGGWRDMHGTFNKTSKF